MAYYPSFMDALTYPASALRLVMSDFVKTGIVSPGDLQVTQLGTPGMGVQVAPGTCYVPWTSQTGKGIYRVASDAIVTLTLASSNASYGRYDAIIMRVYDDGTSTGSKAQLEVVTGTPAPTPSYPTLPANSLLLAYVFVGAGVVSITNAVISDMRTIGGPQKAGGFVMADLAANSVGSNQIQAGAVGTNQISDLAVTSRKMAPLYYWYEGAASGSMSPGLNPAVIGGTQISITTAANYIALIIGTASVLPNANADIYCGIFVDGVKQNPVQHTVASATHDFTCWALATIGAGNHTIDLRLWTNASQLSWGDMPKIATVLFGR